MTISVTDLKEVRSTAAEDISQYELRSANHTANEEALYVLKGVGTLRTKSGEEGISNGDYATFIAGEEGAHQITNTSDETLRYLCFSTMRDPEVLVYPNSDKIGVRGEAPGAPNKNLRADAELNYWEGEK